MAETNIKKRIILIDTSYLFELFEIPGCSTTQAKIIIKKLYGDAINNEDRLYVTLPSVFELGNHISDIDSGSARKIIGDKVFNTILLCFKENAPWTIIPYTGSEDFSNLCNIFSKTYLPLQIGLSAATIIEEAKRMKKKYSSFGYRVHIWTKHKNLKAYEPDRETDPFLG